MALLDIVRWLHIAVGSIALLTLLGPLLSRKGGTLHRRIGQVYVFAMAAVATSGVVACTARLLTEEDPGRRVRAFFLLYVSVLSAATTSMGVRVLRAKHRREAHRDLWDLGLSGLLLAAGLAVELYGLWLRAPLLIGFAPVGIWIGAAQLRYWRRPPTEKMHWWFQHMGGMLGSGIGALTAFAVVNASRFGAGGALWVWLSPVIIGVLGIVLWSRYYHRRFAADRS